MENLQPAFILMAVAGLMLTGAIAGVLAGLLGIGGGIVIVPVLYYLFAALAVPDAISMHLAVATSLATIIPTSVSSARSHHARGAVDLEVVRRWAPFVFAGAASGGFLAGYLDARQLTLLFGTIAILVAINMALPKTLVLADNLPKSVLPQGIIGACIGLISSLMGIGGGTLSVPALTLFGYPAHRAIGTAAAFGFVIAVPGVLGFMLGGWGVEGRPFGSIGYVNIIAAALIFSTSVLTAPIGSRIAHWLPARQLKIGFAVFLVFTGLRMLRSVL